MSKRLEIARNLLSKDGVIFISIDDNEHAQLKILCDQIFGEQNFINDISIKSSESTGVKMAHVEKRLPKLKEHILFYKKQDIEINDIRIRKDKWDNEYKILVEGVSKEELQIIKELMNSETITDEQIEYGDKICNRMKFSNLNKLYNDNMNDEEKIETNYSNSYRILRDVATSSGAKKIADMKKERVNGGAFLIRTKRNKIYLMRSDYNEKSTQPRAKLLFADEYLEVNVGDFWFDIKTTGLADEGEVEFLKGKKPLKLIDRLLKIHTNKNAIILDFFAGSGTTGHAVAQLNKEDGGNRRYILCTNNENSICENVTYQRLKNIQDELPHNLKYFKTEFIPRFSEDDEGIKQKLMHHIKELIELEYGCEIDGVNNLFIENEDALAQYLTEELKQEDRIFIAPYILLDQAQNALIHRKQARVIDIPEYYFRNELVDAGEL